MRMLKDGVCAYDLVIGDGAWFHKTNQRGAVHDVFPLRAGQ